MCHRCCMSVMKFSKNVTSSNSKIASLHAAADECNKTWVPFDELQSESDCNICKTFDCQKKGGRPLNPSRNRNTHPIITDEQSVFSPQSSSTPFKPSTSPKPALKSQSINQTCISIDEDTEEVMDVDNESPASPINPNADDYAILIDSGTSPFFERMRS